MAKTKKADSRGKLASPQQPLDALPKRAALYAGTFDPMTLGHLDIIVRAANLFDAVVIGIAKSSKQPIFSVEERLVMVRDTCRYIPKVHVVAFEGLTVDFARENRISCLIRGVRNHDDFSFELQMAHMNKNLNRLIDTVFIPTSQEFSHISSTLVREIARFGGEAGKLVPPLVFKELAEKLSV